jgi:hypothetical protein
MGSITCDTLYSQKLALTSATSGGRSVGIVYLRTKATEFSFSLYNIHAKKAHIMRQNGILFVVFVSSLFCAVSMDLGKFPLTPQCLIKFNTFLH